MKIKLISIITISAMIMLSACSAGTGNSAQAGADAQANAGEQTGDVAQAGGQAADAAADQAGGQSEANIFVFSANGTDIHMKQDMSELLDSLGDTTNYAESPSCAFEGIDKIYSYKGFDVYTYPDGDTDRVNAVYFTDDATQTAGGIHIGSSVEEMEAAYGTDYTEEWEVYTYADGDASLEFVTTDGVIESVEYTAVLEK